VAGACSVEVELPEGDALVVPGGGAVEVSLVGLAGCVDAATEAVTPGMVAAAIPAKTARAAAERPATAAVTRPSRRLARSLASGDHAGRFFM
jgi:hypothetical protein